MPKVLFGDFTGVDASEGYDDYAGPMPPRGVYRVTTNYIKSSVSSNGNPMLTIAFKISEPEGSPKAKFNGYTIWDRLTSTPKSMPLNKSKLTALGVKVEGRFGVVTDPADEAKVTKLGNLALSDLEALATTKVEPEGEYPARLAVASLAPVPAGYGVPSATTDDNYYDDDDASASSPSDDDDDDDSF